MDWCALLYDRPSLLITYFVAFRRISALPDRHHRGGAANDTSLHQPAYDNSRRHRPLPRLVEARARHPARSHFASGDTRPRIRRYSPPWVFRLPRALSLRFRSVYDAGGARWIWFDHYGGDRRTQLLAEAGADRRGWLMFSR